MAVLEIVHLTKSFGSITAVDNLNLVVEQGQILGILGPNGSGKTTTLGLILSIIKPDHGTFTWFGGQYGKDERMHIGALLETPNFYPYMSAQRNLELIAHIKKARYPRINELLSIVGLDARRNYAFDTFSFGMKQRLAIAAALIGDPPVLIFDEPTTGLDPQGIAEIRILIRNIAEKGKTVIMASHILDEVEKVCSHVAILKKGKLLAHGQVGTIINNYRQVEIGADNLEKLKSLLAKIVGIHKMETRQDKLLLQVDDSITATDISKISTEAGILITHLVFKTKSLETEFLEITNSES